MALAGIFAATSALRVFSHRLERSAHNLANASTNGFTPTRTHIATGSQGSGVQVTGATTLNPGPIVSTGGPLDLAIDGPGFFQFNNGQGGLVFSRNGNLAIDNHGRLVDSQGRSLNPGIVVPAQAAQVHVSPNGNLQTVDANGQVLFTGQIQTAVFGNSGALAHQGGNVFRATRASGPPVAAQPGSPGHGEIISGAVQASGTNLAREMVSQIMDLRFFEANVRSVETRDQMLGSLLDISG